MAEASDPPGASAPRGGTGWPTVEDLVEAHGGRIIRIVRGANRVLHALAGVTMVALLAWTVGDIIGRSFFSNPLPGTVELTQLAVVVLVYLGLAHTEQQDAHISVDLLYVRLGSVARLALRLFAGVVALAIIAVVTWRLYLYVGQLDAGGYTTGVHRLPLAPVAMAGVVGIAAFGVAVLVNIVLALRGLVSLLRER